MYARLFLALVTSLLLAATAGEVYAQTTAAPGKLYKWVDKDGNVHFSDQVPADQAGYAREKMNDQGVSVEKVERALTGEEQAKKLSDEASAIALAKRLGDEKKADEILLNSYASETDLKRAYDQRMDLLGQTIEARRIEINAREQSLSSLVAEAANLERAGKPVSDTLKQMITAERGEIDKQKAYLKQKDSEKGQALIDYQRDQARYKAALARDSERKQGN